MQSNLPAKIDERTMEFVPYGAEDKIKLTIGIIQKLVAVKTKSGATCSESDAIKFMMMCSARRLNPFEGDAFLIGFDGKDGPQFSLITAHQAFLKRAELNAEYDGMKSGIIVQEDGGGVIDLEGDFFMEGQKLLGGWATVFFKNRKQPMTKRVRLKTFQKPWGIWQENPAGMICKCAEADALRSSFPTMLGGLYLREELPATAQEPKVATPIFTPTNGVAEPKAIPQSDGIVKQVRDLCDRDKIRESELLFFIGEVFDGVEGSLGSLEEIHLAQEKTLPMVVEQWSDISKRIIDNRNQK